MTRTALVALFVAWLAAAPVRAGHIGQPEADVSAQLVEASRKLFGESVGASPVVTRTGGVERFSEGYDFDVYEVRGPSETAKLIRLQVHPDATSQIDLALRYEGGKIAGVVPLRDVILEGKPFARLPELFALLAKRPAKAYARGLSRFFEGLELLEQGAAGPRPAPVAGPAGVPPMMSAKQRTLAAGEILPAFKGTALTGEPLTEAALAGRPAMVVFGGLRQSRVHDAVIACAKLSRKYPAIALLAVVTDPAKDALALLPPAVAGWLAPRTLADEDRTVTRAFKVVAVPYIVLFDARGKMFAHEFFTGRDPIEARLVALVGATAAAAPAVAPTPAPGVPGVPVWTEPVGPIPDVTVKKSFLSRSKKAGR